MVKPHAIQRHWFLLGLLGVSVTGLIGHSQFRPFADQVVIRNGIVAVVMFLMALPLDTGALGRSLLSPWAPLLGVVMNIVALPLIAWGLSLGLTGELKAGLLVTAAVPCTLASAAVWTRRAGGDDGVAVLVTVITNVTCFLVTPFWLWVTTGSGVSPSTLSQLQALPTRLIGLVLVPMILAQLLRRRVAIADWTAQHRATLGNGAQVGILSMVLVGAIQSGEKLSQARGFDLGEFPRLALATCGLHCITLALGMWCARQCGFARSQQIAIGIAGSQKTLMIGLDIALQAFGGIAIIPMVVYHFVQLMIDTVVADRLAASANSVDHTT